MRTLSLLPLLLLFVFAGQDSATPQDGSSVTVVGFKWAKSRQVIERLNDGTPPPVAAVIPQNKNFARNARVNDSIGARDPNGDTIDGRSAAIEKNIQDSRTPHGKPVDGFEYRVKIKNSSAKVMEVVFWEYQFKETANPSTIARRQFLCGLNLKPGKDKELVAFSMTGPSDVISVDSLAKKNEILFDENIVINRVEYSDGTIWQRKSWNFGEVRLGIQRAISTPWGTEMCRGL